MSEQDDATDLQNDLLAHVILLEAALIEFRGFYLRRDTDSMADALVKFTQRVDALYQSMQQQQGPEAKS